MKLFNSFSRKLEEVDLSQKIGIYVCGITPYDTTHIGHAFTFLAYDVLVRYLKFLGSQVTYVQNVTDIDDDILIRAKKVGVNWRELGKAQTKKYLDDMKALNNLPFDYFPKSTKHIHQMIQIIRVLLNKNLAYEKNGSVYFEVKKDKNFGKLSKLAYPAMLEIANERGNYPEDPNKRDPLDFVLWQKHKDNEPYWDSPWGRGRSGWHIECSAMSIKYLGPTITIHGGGEDLVFPHHEAEIVQSENYTGKMFVKIWMHAAMVYCKEKKMSKSLGNMIFVSDLLKRYDANTIRIFLLSHHYRKAWNYQGNELKEAQKTSDLLRKTALLKNSVSQKNQRSFLDALDNDLDIPRALITLKKLALQKQSAAIRKFCPLLGLTV